jgi:thiosulfate reductase/polysulfide reductase chain A
VVAISFHCGHTAYGRYASGKPVDGDFVQGDANDQDAKVAAWKNWKRGVNPNWIIPNAPDPVSGQWRSNDTVVKIEKA